MLVALSRREHLAFDLARLRAQFSTQSSLFAGFDLLARRGLQELAQLRELLSR
jgi:hypothetical protein